MNKGFDAPGPPLMSRKWHSGRSFQISSSQRLMFGALYSSVRQSFQRKRVSSLSHSTPYIISRHLTRCTEIYIDPNNISNNCSFHDVEIAATSFGRALRSRWNWQSGDVLAIFAGNCIDTPVVTCGALYANGVVSPINPAYTVNELKHQLSDCNAKAIITHAAFLDVVLQAGMPRDRILLIGNECHADVLHYTDLLPTGSFRARKPSSPSDLAYLVYSSGTTGTYIPYVYNIDPYLLDTDCIHRLT